MNTSSKNKSIIFVVSLLLILMGATGCSNTNNAQKGGAIGAGAGAVVGGVIGKATGKTTRGVLIGAVIGGTAGAIIGRQMDKQAEELEDDLEGAEVARVGEGIEITFDSALLFGFDSAALSANARDNLNDLARSLSEYPNTDVLIVGHTDNVGTDSYNQDLSERRAQSAANYLAQQGVAPGRLSIVGYGESQPVATNDTDLGRQQNRRVEVAIYASEEYREQVQSTSP